MQNDLKVIILKKIVAIILISILCVSIISCKTGSRDNSFFDGQVDSIKFSADLKTISITNDEGKVMDLSITSFSKDSNAVFSDYDLISDFMLDIPVEEGVYSGNFSYYLYDLINDKQVFETNGDYDRYNLSVDRNVYLPKNAEGGNAYILSVHDREVSKSEINSILMHCENTVFSEDNQLFAVVDEYWDSVSLCEFNGDLPLILDTELIDVALAEFDVFDIEKSKLISDNGTWKFIVNINEEVNVKLEYDNAYENEEDEELLVSSVEVCSADDKQSLTLTNKNSSEVIAVVSVEDVYDGELNVFLEFSEFFSEEIMVLNIVGYVSDDNDEDKSLQGTLFQSCFYNFKTNKVVYKPPGQVNYEDLGFGKRLYYKGGVFGNYGEERNGQSVFIREHDGEVIEQLLPDYLSFEIMGMVFLKNKDYIIVVNKESGAVELYSVLDELELVKVYDIDEMFGGDGIIKASLQDFSINDDESEVEVFVNGVYIVVFD